VLGSGIGDHADGGASDGDQGGDLAGPVGAHFHHGKAMRRRQPQQRQRHADVVVEIAAGGQTVTGLPEDRGRHLLGGGLAVAARHAHQWAAKVRAPVARGALERRLGIGHDDLRQPEGCSASTSAPAAQARAPRRRSRGRRTSAP